ncbi:hypothetical protein ACN47E_002726 [Coniothyrium glycines]
MSMFRRPGEDSSSSSESSSDCGEEDDRTAPQRDSVLSRINTLESAAAESTRLDRPLRATVRQSSDQNVRDLMLHALLEKDALREAAEHLGKDPTDPEVLSLAREAYQRIARQISNNVSDAYAKEEMQAHRTAAQEGISRLTRTNLTQLAAIPEGTSRALVVSNAVAVNTSRQPSSNFNVLSGMSAPAELHLRGYPGLQTDRYVREFAELGIVGRGGYGRVYKAKHRLDGSFYAVKRIPISPAKVTRIQEHGPQELESMLEEVRSLARFEHNNIVRYHNAWLEFTTTPHEKSGAAKSTVLREDRLLEDPAAFVNDSLDLDPLHSNFRGLTPHDPLLMTDHSDSAGIVFEASEPGGKLGESRSDVDDMSLKEKLRIFKRKNRRGSQASQATIATISSTKSRMSAVEDVDEDEEEEDIELIPRSHMPYSQEPTTDMSESMFSQSDVPDNLISKSNVGPILMLNLQMSLCDTNLAAFLSPEHTNTDSHSVRHCFHPGVSLELLNNIVSGVEYLHAQGVVHRDLKPANVFLSLSTTRHPPYGSVDLSTCKPCPKRASLHLTPRIGDFGLVAALDEKSLGVSIGSKPVGTEFYRPQSSRGINEKLDIFALGVVTFEMLQRFATRMERIAALTELRRGIFPAGFARSLGDLGEQVQQLVGDMLQPDEAKRFSCAEVKTELSKLVHILQA